MEKSVGKEDAIVALKRLRPDVFDGVTLGNYFDDRGRVIDELFGGRVSFQVRLEYEERTRQPFEKPLGAFCHDGLAHVCLFHLTWRGQGGYSLSQGQDEIGINPW